jgi:NAD(P)-dependent dehydrogenase (short-subunit alcohol dehydrogenase family)
VGEVGIPPHLRDFQARWKSPALGLFHGAPSSTALFTHRYCYRSHLSRIWDEELSLEGVRVLSIDPGDMDTPLHAAAVPDADRSTLKSPEVAARELADTVAAVLSRRTETIVQEAIG